MFTHQLQVYPGVTLQVKTLSLYPYKIVGISHFDDERLLLLTVNLGFGSYREIWNIMQHYSCVVFLVLLV